MCRQLFTRQSVYTRRVRPDEFDAPVGEGVDQFRGERGKVLRKNVPVLEFAGIQEHTFGQTVKRR